MLDAAKCTGGAEEQAVNHIIFDCNILRPPNRLEDLRSPDIDNTQWFEDLVGFAWTAAHTQVENVWNAFNTRKCLLNRTRTSSNTVTSWMQTCTGWIFLPAPAPQTYNQGSDRPLKTFESNVIRRDILQVGKQHSRHKNILSSIALSQQCCEVYSISPTLQ